MKGKNLIQLRINSATEESHFRAGSMKQSHEIAACSEHKRGISLLAITTKGARLKPRPYDLFAYQSSCDYKAIPSRYTLATSQLITASPSGRKAQRQNSFCRQASGSTSNLGLLYLAERLTLVAGF